ncbi:MAG: biotin/lipoyl-binding protein [Planctomycetes bacterium]|nr:biotin/lipoyl-binding protein [Planctomycetota bacterium]
MSSDPSAVNSETIEQTRQQIRGLVSEIAQLSKSDLGPDEYYPALMQRILQALAAVGGAVWTVGEGRGLRMRYQINLSESLLDTDTEDAQRHMNLLRFALASRRSHLIPPLSSAEKEEFGANPTRYLLVLAPITADGDPEAIIEVFQRSDSPPATQRGYERFLTQMCELAGEWLKSQKLRHFSDRHSLWAQADQFARLVHESLSLRETAYTVVNEGRRLIGADRVTLAIRRGRKCVVEAVSGQDTVESRSNVIAALNELASKVVATGETLWYEGHTDDLPPQLDRAIHRYVEESYAKTIIVMPLRRPKSVDMKVIELKRHEASAERNESNEIIGAMIIEQIETDLPRELLAPRIDLVYEHAARAMSNTVVHNSLFLMPVWRSLGKAGWVVQARNLPKTLTAIAAMLVLVVAMFVIPVDFKLAADGTLEPVDKKFVFVNVPGTVVELKVKDQQKVAKDDVIAVMENPELTVELKKIEGERSVTEQRLAAVRAATHVARLAEDERHKLFGQVLELEQSLKSLDEQVVLRRRQIEDLTVVAPASGQIMLSWDVERSLLGRHVEPGQVIMAVANLQGDWELELAMPDRRVGHVNRARLDRSEGDRDLPVDYVLATDPRRQLKGELRYVDQVTRVEGEAGHVVLLRVGIAKGDLESNLRPGAKVHARVVAGRTNLGYRLFHEVIAWVQTKLLF